MHFDPQSLAPLLSAEILAAGGPDRQVRAGFTSDLLSNVMANAAEDCLLVTIQAHKNTAAVASLVGAAGILICSSRTVPADFVQACTTEGIWLLRSTLDQFEASGILYRLLEA